MIFNLLSRAKDLFYNNVLSQLKSTNVQDAIDELSGQIQTATGSELALLNSAEGYLMDINVEGKSVQDGTPTPDSPVAIKSVSDCVELQSGAYNFTTGAYITESRYISNRYKIPCNSGDIVKIKTEQEFNQCGLIYYNGDTYVSKSDVVENVTFTEYEAVVPSGVTHFNFDLRRATAIDLDTVGKVELTINDRYVLQLKSCNKNLFSPSEVATWDIYNTVDYKKKVYKLKANTQYVLATNISNYGNIYFNTTTSFIGTARATTDNNGNLYIIVKADVVPNSEIMLCESSLYDGVYVPHKESVTTILLPEPLRAVGEVKDEIVCKDGVYGVLRRIASVTLRGIESWISGGTSSGAFRSAINMSDIVLMSNNITVANILCNAYVARTATETWNSIEGISVDNNKNILFYDSRITTLGEWKSCLTSNPITVQYELATPVFEPINPTPFYNISTYEGGTTVNTTDRLQPVLTGDYPVSETAGVASKGYATSQALSELKYDVSELDQSVAAISEDITEINSDIDNFKNHKYAVVNIKTPVYSDVNLVCMGVLPTGFTKDNTVVIAVAYRLKDSESATGDMQFTPYMHANAIYPKVWVEDSLVKAEIMHPTYKYADIRIVIMRTDI